MQKPITPIRAGVDAGLLLQKFARRVEVLERVAIAAIERHQRARNTDEAHAVAIVEVGRECGVAKVGNHPGDSPDVVIEPEDLVDNDNAGMLLRIGRRRVSSAHRAPVVGGESDVGGGHRVASFSELPLSVRERPRPGAGEGPNS